MSRISIRMDDKLREEAEQILDEIGLSMSGAVNIFVRQLVREGGLPFVPATKTVKRDSRRESLTALLEFASSNSRLESDFKFDREDCYVR